MANRFSACRYIVVGVLILLCARGKHAYRMQVQSCLCLDTTECPWQTCFPHAGIQLFVFGYYRVPVGNRFSDTTQCLWRVGFLHVGYSCLCSDSAQCSCQTGFLHASRRCTTSAVQPLPCARGKQVFCRGYILVGALIIKHAPGKIAVPSASRK